MSIGLVPRYPDSAAILQATDNGLTWFKWYVETYLGRQLKRIGNRYRVGSISIYRLPNGLWSCTRHSTGESGTLFSFAGQLYQLNPKTEFKTILEQIIQDLNLPEWRFVKEESKVASTLPIHSTPIEKTTWIANNGKPLEQKFSYQLAKNNTALLQYFGAWDIAISTLNRYNVYAADYTKHLKSGRTFTDELTILYKIGDKKTIKAKRPYVKKKGAYREFYLQNSGNYVFGHRQLPEKCDYIIICEGEKDTLLVNNFFNKVGIYAICFHSVSARIDEKYLQYLQHKCQNKVFTCFDNDAAGAKFSHKNALKLGIPSVDISAYSAENDLCDVYIKEGIKGLIDIFSSELSTKTAVKKDENNPFSWGIPTALSLNINQYISENTLNLDTNTYPIDTLKQYIFKHNQLILQAPTGSGKTTALMKIAQDHEFLSQNKVKRVIFCMPYQILAQQLANDYSLPCVLQGTTPLELNMALSSSISICTYDSLKKLEYGVDEALLIVDEFHNLRNQANFRMNACVEVLEYMNIAPKTICLSATPLYEFTHLMQYNLVKVQTKKSLTPIIQPIEYQGTRLEAILNHDFNVNIVNNINIIKINDITLLKTLRTLLKKKYQLTDEEITLFCSSEKEQNKQYIEISKSGKVTNHIKFILTTSIINDGVNINNENIGDIILINEFCEASLVQFIARFRKAKQLKVYAYRKQKEVIPQHLRKWTQPTDEALNIKYKRAKLQLDHIQTIDNQKVDNYKEWLLRDFPFLYYSTLNGTYQVNQIAILHQEYQRQKSTTTTEQFYQNIQFNHPHITVLPTQSVSVTKNKAANETLKAQKNTIKQQKQQAYTLLHQDKNRFLEVSYHYSKNPKLKNKIRQHLLINTHEMSLSAQQVFDTNESLFKAHLNEETSQRFFDLRQRNIPEETIPKILLKNQSNKDYGRFIHTLTAQVQLRLLKINKNNLNPIQIAEAKHSKAIIRAISQLPKGKRCFTGFKIKTLIGKILKDENISQERAITRLSGLYQITKFKKKVKGKRLTFYRIEDKLGYKQFLKDNDIKIAAFEAGLLL